MRDKYGNNALHLCVKHELTKMYDHVLQKAEQLMKNHITLKYLQARETFELDKVFYLNDVV